MIPVYDEADSLRPLAEALQRALGALNRPYEILFVDDGSRDGSTDVLRELAEQHRDISACICRRNFGKANAMDVGFKLARGEVLVTLDADLQDDPAEIAAMLDKLDEGADMVVGWKSDRRDAWHKVAASRLFNAVIRLAAGLRLHDIDCGLKVFRREVVANIPLYGDLHRFLPVLAHRQGFRVAELPVTHHPRRHGSSKYGAERLLRGAFDFLTVMFITKYAARPMHFFGKLGLALGLAGAALSCYLVGLKLNGEYLGHRPLLNLAVLLLIVGALFVSTGLLGEMLVHLHKRDERKVAAHILRCVYGDARQDSA